MDADHTHTALVDAPASVPPGFVFSDDVLDLVADFLLEIAQEEEAERAANEPLVPLCLTVGKFAEAHGYSKRAVLLWISLGMPHTGIGRDLRVDVPGALRWIERLRSGALRPTGKSVVYFVRDGAGRIKIGWSTNLSRRLVELQRDVGGPVEVLGTIDGDRRTEAALHALLAADRLDGEWFRPSEDVMAAIPHRRAT